MNYKQPWGALSRFFPSTRIWRPEQNILHVNAHIPFISREHHEPQLNNKLRAAMTEIRPDENDPEDRSDFAGMGGDKNLATEGDRIQDDDFPHQELFELYVLVAILLCFWLLMALFFARMPQTLFALAVNLAT